MPEKNAESFFANPFSTEKGYERMYATGDYFRYLPDGTLGIIGRRDGQVKVRGNRVELTEVEACIRSMEGVEDVTVQPIVSDNGAKELCAYIVASSAVTAEEVRSYVSDRKPDYMVPAFVMNIGAIPVNSHGKVDRRALPKPDMGELRSEYIAPNNEKEEAICKALSEALGIGEMGVTDDFIRLGGDSLKAIRAVALCRKAGYDTDVVSILSLRTPSAIASSVSVAEGRPSGYSVETGCPLTGGALDVFLDVESGKSDISYVVLLSVPIPDGYTDDEAKAAVNDLLRAHPILKARIIVGDDGPKFVFDSEPEITISDVPDRNIGAPFEMERCLSRFNIVSGSSIQMAVHHTVFDGTSVVVVTRALKGIFAGEQPDPDLGFIRDTEAHISADIGSKMEFFREIFADSDDISPLVEDGDGSHGRYFMELSSSVSEISRYSSEISVIPANLLTAAFGYTLSRFTGSSGAIFSTVVDGRGMSGLQNSVGMFVHALPVALDCRNRSVSMFVSECNRILLEAMKRQNCTIFRISKELDVNPNVVFNYMTGLGLSKEMQEDGTMAAAVTGDLTFNIYTSGDRYTLEYSHSAKYSDASVKRIAESFDRIVSGMLRCKNLSDIRYTSSEDILLQDALNRTD